MLEQMRYVQNGIFLGQKDMITFWKTIENSNHKWMYVLLKMLKRLHYFYQNRYEISNQSC